MLKSIIITLIFISAINCFSQDPYEDSLKVLSNEKVIFLEDASILNNHTNSRDSSIINELMYDDYPEPFAPPQPIKFKVYKKSTVRLRFYDVYENLLKTLVWDDLSPGRYSFKYWNFFSDLPSGVYTCNIEITQTKKKVFLIK